MKITRNISLTLLILFAVAPVFAQKMSWKKHLKLAETAFKNAEYAEAGNHYREAWRQKTKKKELIYKAGEAFFIIRDYQNAADAFKHVKDENDKYPLIGLRYARCLKQSGQYDEASQAFVDFISKYQGSDKPLVTKIVQNEIRGCEMALEWMSRDKAGEVELRLLGPTVNTPETEFAPFPFSDEILYFSSTAGKRAEIYRTQKIDGEWTQAIVPESFPKIESGHFCNGTLTPDQKRFYFTICESVESWGGLTTRCDIYVTRRENNTWTTPEKLRDYINMEGVTTTHPFVVHKDDIEILYFSSNRAGGHGGMDLWYTTRSISSNDLDFTFPVNLGETINTRGDEITPYYDDRDGLLYFSSNGHPSAGGYDIFMAKGSKSAWADVENIGPPFNSPADDFFFVKSPSRKTGFLVSNRTFDMEKVTTLDEDIFEFDLNVERPIYAKGGVYDQESGELLQNVTVSLYERMPAGSKKLVTNQNFENGNYYFDLMPEKMYAIEAQKDGFYPKSYDFDTNDFLVYEDFGAPIYLKKMEQTIEESPTVFVPKEEPKPGFEKKPVNTKPSKELEISLISPEKPATEIVSKEKTLDIPETKPEPKPEPTPESRAINADLQKEKDKYILRGKSKADRYEIITDAPRLVGTYYKIQLIAVAKYDINHPRYNEVRNMGRLDTEYIVDKKWTRVLLADYASLEEAEKDLAKVRKMKNFERAFIVKYIDGERIGRVK